jgi:hypothetical protein
MTRPVPRRQKYAISAVIVRPRRMEVPMSGLFYVLVVFMLVILLNERHFK